MVHAADLNNCLRKGWHRHYGHVGVKYFAFNGGGFKDERDVKGGFWLPATQRQLLEMCAVGVTAFPSSYIKRYVKHFILMSTFVPCRLCWLIVIWCQMQRI